MSRSLKSLMLVSCLLTLFLASSDFNQLEAAYGRWGAYNNERGAWGGNGGWWGGGNSDWYGDYGWPGYSNYYGGYYGGYNPRYDNYYAQTWSDLNEMNVGYGGYSPYGYGGYGGYNGYYFNNNYPYYGQYYGDGIGAGAGIDGAGLYFNIR